MTNLIFTGWFDVEWVYSIPVIFFLILPATDNSWTHYSLYLPCTAFSLDLLTLLTNNISFSETQLGFLIKYITSLFVYLALIKRQLLFVYVNSWLLLSIYCWEIAFSSHQSFPPQKSEPSLNIIQSGKSTSG